MRGREINVFPRSGLNSPLYTPRAPASHTYTRADLCRLARSFALARCCRIEFDLSHFLESRGSFENRSTIYSPRCVPLFHIACLIEYIICSRIDNLIILRKHEENSRITHPVINSASSNVFLDLRHARSYDNQLGGC